MGIIVFYAAFYSEYFCLFFFLIISFYDKDIVFQIIICILAV